MITNSEIIVPRYDSAWTPKMIQFLLNEKERLKEEFESALIKAMPEICRSWGDNTKADRIGCVVLCLNLSLETFKECQEIVRQWSGFYENRRKW